MNYLDKINPKTKEYFKILEPNFPEWLVKYINTKELLNQQYISMTCGTIYTSLFDTSYFFSSLDHSIAVALIIWHFTKDKKQTLSGLFHDIATPAFKHCIDMMNGDFEKQESTEELTTKIIKDSKEIMGLLERDGIKIEEVDDYHIYPIADNDTPMLSADRLEYTLSNGLGVRKELWGLKEIKEVYDNIEVQVNEQGIEELGFKDKEIAEKFVKIMSQLSIYYISNTTNFSMQFLSDVMKVMSNHKLISKKDLYECSEQEVIERIENCNIGNVAKCFKTWRESNTILESDEFVDGTYCLIGKNKKRYIIPLVKVDNKFVRINEVSDSANQDVQRFLDYKPKKYCYLKMDKSLEK